MPTKSPVAFCIFNRPATTARVWKAIADAKPETLLIVGDAARAGRAGEAERVADARKIVEAVDWPCRVRTNYAKSNMGCKARIASGLKWIFEEVPEAIILEDDCLPDPSFFPYCEELLERYRGDERVFAINGTRSNPTNPAEPASYYFSKYFGCWGWASWRRSYVKYDASISDWPEFLSQGKLGEVADLPDEAWYWREIFKRVHDGRIDTWDFQWLYACWRQGAMCITPASNLISNIGFDGDGTHATNPNHPLANLPTTPLAELKHPHWMIRDKREDISTYLTGMLRLHGIQRVKWLIRVFLRERRQRFRKAS